MVHRIEIILGLLAQCIFVLPEVKPIKRIGEVGCGGIGCGR